MERDATLTEIREFFGYEGLAELKKDWTALSAEEKAYFKKAVAEEIDSRE